jgi:ATP-binding cassette, subfamily C (CFTR/MRP), member 4
MTSLERIIEYTQVEFEDLESKKVDPPKDWPQNGSISLSSVSYAYDKNLPNVLNELSLNINAQEKIGIVGRTGAGKSSFFQCLLRLGEQTQGTIRIDGIDIKEISLQKLRSNISIIPVRK